MVVLVPFIYYGKQLKPYGRKSAFIVICVLLVQIADMAKAIERSIVQHNYQVSRAWPQLAKYAAEATIVYTYPLFQRHMVSPDDMQYLTAALAPKQIPITAGHLPRPDVQAMQRMIDSVHEMMESGHWNLDQGGILITTEEKAAGFLLLQQKREIKVRRLGDYRILYHIVNLHADRVADQLQLPLDSISALSLSTFLEENKKHTMIILTADEASRALRPDRRAELNRFSPLLGSMGGWEAYAAIWHQGKMKKEQKVPKGKDIDMEDLIGNTVIRLRATSGIQQQPYLELNGTAQPQPGRGVTVFVFDDHMQLIDRINFDLYETYYGNR